jgi:hypothetical protein
MATKKTDVTPTVDKLPEPAKQAAQQAQSLGDPDTIAETVREVKSDFADRGDLEGHPLGDQEPGHTRSEEPPKQVDGNQAPDAPRYVHLPALISDEFGTPRSEARLQIALGTVQIDGVDVNPGQDMDLLYDDIVGRTIDVKGRDRRYIIHYRG